MGKKYNILVTAIGGDIGQSVARVLRRFDIVGSVIGTDISDDHPGAFFVHRCYTIPRADSPEFIGALQVIVKKENIDFVIPISEPELKIMHRAGLDGTWGVVRVVSPQGNVLPTCLDKFETVEYLKRAGIATPWTQLVQDGPPPILPCIMKDRWSWGSKSVLRVEDDESVRYWMTKRPQGIFQELLLPDTQEYTCGVFRTSQGKTQVVILRRVLAGGLTGRAEVVFDEQIEELCRGIADAFGLRGSINVQLRKTRTGPLVFEINPRFSSTVLFREMIGFRDVLWSLLDLMGEKIDHSFVPPVGTKFYRVFDEKIISP